MTNTTATAEEQDTACAVTVASTKSVEKTIVVNGREHRFAGSDIGRAELVRLAFPAMVGPVGSALTVAYDNGPANAPAGLLTAGRTTRVLDGQSFSVSLTDKS